MKNAATSGAATDAVPRMETKTATTQKKQEKETNLRKEKIENNCVQELRCYPTENSIYLFNDLHLMRLSCA